MEFLQQFTQYSDWGLLVLRVVVGCIFIYHGLKKVSSWKKSDGGMNNIMRTLFVVEPLAGLGLILGVYFHLSALLLTLTMVGALYFHIFKWKTPFSGEKKGWEFELTLLASSVMLFLVGAGAIAF